MDSGTRGKPRPTEVRPGFKAIHVGVGNPFLGNDGLDFIRRSIPVYVWNGLSVIRRRHRSGIGQAQIPERLGDAALVECFGVARQVAALSGLGLEEEELSAASITGCGRFHKSDEPTLANWGRKAGPKAEIFGAV